MLQESLRQFDAVREMTYAYQAWMREGERWQRSRCHCHIDDVGQTPSICEWLRRDAGFRDVGLYREIETRGGWVLQLLVALKARVNQLRRGGSSSCLNTNEGAKISRLSLQYGGTVVVLSQSYLDKGPVRHLSVHSTVLYTVVRTKGYAGNLLAPS